MSAGSHPAVTSLLTLAIGAVTTASGRERVKRARKAYSDAIASGARPIEGVGTAVAAFVGLADEGPSNVPRSPGVYVDEVPSSGGSIEDVETSTESFVEPDPEKP